MAPRTPAKNQSPKTKTPAAKPLAQEHADFTAEGAPPPGKVALGEPVTRRSHQPRPPEPTAQSLTTNQGLALPDNHNSLKAGLRGPTLLEDFILREKITHFDHERIPERAVHARGAGAHGFFQVYENMAGLTKAQFLSDPALQTPVFVRFSTVAGSRGSADTARDARGFAVKFYTAEGNYDLVGNNIPVFFIQDAIKFPDLVHAVKPEPHNEIPQAASAHDTFWDFVTLMPESTHMLMWVMSDRAIPRSFRMMEGFGVHTFRMVNAQGDASFVKFHWKPLLGTHGLAWDEAQKLAGKDADFHRRDLWEAIDSGNFPEWELGVQVVPEEDEFRFSFDLLDPTKLIPEELVPVRRIGRMVLNRNPDNFFAETEQVAFHPGHLVPGIDFSNDPLLQGRLFSYTDTQLSRLGSANFHELPINRAQCPMHNFQRDGMHRQQVNTGRVAYEPNTLASGNEFRVDGTQAQAKGFSSVHEALESPKIRQRSPSFDDHFSQARMFWLSQTEPEQDHIVAAFQFELSKLETPAIRQRMVDNLAHVDGQLAARVAAPLGIGAPNKQAATLWSGFRAAPHPVDVQPSPALSMAQAPGGNIATRTVAILVANGVDATSVQTMQQALADAGASSKVVAAALGTVQAADGTPLPVDCSLLTTPSVVFDAVFLPCMGLHAAAMAADGDAVHFVLEAYKHCKTIGACGSGAGLLASLGAGQVTEPGVVLPLPGVVLAAAGALPAGFAPAFIQAMGQHRHWSRSGLATVPA
ncbi:catalase [Rhodoferax ferrireducens]|uniref:Catalase n=1 Tax=Rhodoferax ferrireducens TaxID=192843 RepID=A0ABU2C4H9_9BURK|nr:catalase [Rhodoferax ferrireducens]MDR7376236.1 catalase [Rhodoferax ferrireducens]